MVWISIEANIASGKTTFLNLLSQNKYFESEILYEPVDQWTKEGQNILDYFYKDPKRWSLTLQYYAFATRAETYLKPQNQALRVSERCLETDFKVFATNCYKSELLNTVEWSLYNKTYGILNNTFNWLKPDGYVYLRADPDVCYNRLQKRQRAEESNVPLEYLKSVHDRHEEWLMTDKADNILVLDANNDFEHTPEVLDSFVQKVGEFIKTLETNSNNVKNISNNVEIKLEN